MRREDRAERRARDERNGGEDMGRTARNHCRERAGERARVEGER